MNQTLAYRKNSNQNKKLAKVLAKAIFWVGFVTPLLFGNIAEAANFASGNVQWLNNEILNKTDATKWATTVGTDYSNYVYVDGYKFKIVKTEGTGANARLPFGRTIWMTMTGQKDLESITIPVTILRGLRDGEKTQTKHTGE